MTYIGATVVAGIFSRIWFSYRKDRAARRAMNTALFPNRVLESILAPGEDDDPNILSELKNTILLLNRQTYAEEFWNLDKNLVKYHKHIPVKSRPTMERMLIRCIESDEKWLQIMGAKTSSALKLAGSEDAIQKAIAKNSADDRFKTALESCLETLSPSKQQV
jgi:hypothetical protein